MPGPWKFWKVKPDGKWTETWIDLVDTDDAGPWWEAAVKWDGCVHLYQYSNLPADSHDRIIKTEHGKFKGPGVDDPDYLHICDMDDFVARMTELTEIAREWFTSHGGINAQMWEKKKEPS